jgi:hypothetical protein
MTDECDFDDTLRTMLGTPPFNRSRVVAEPQDDGDDLDEPQEQDETDLELG